MTYHFKNIIVRKPNKSIQNALSSQNINPVYKNILEEHTSYLKTISALGLKINILDPLEDFPDSIFVEDPALIYRSTCIVLNPANKTRNGEKSIIKKEMQQFFDNIMSVEKGFVEGGDVLNINQDHFIIGISNRTNKVGAENLSKLLQSLGASVKICETPKNVLHFKSECSFIDDDVILVSSNMAQIEYLKSNYKLIKLPIGEEGAANTLRINDKLLIPYGFNKAEEILSNKYSIIKIKVDEISKIDAGLSCMSLRW